MAFGHGAFSEYAISEGGAPAISSGTVAEAAQRLSWISFGDFQFGSRWPDATDMDETGDRENELSLFAGFNAPAGSEMGLFGDRRRRSIVVILENRI